MPTPFHGKRFTFRQPDGSDFEVRGWGDQHYAVFETLDGHTVVRNPANGYFEIARLSDDGDLLLPAGELAHRPGAAPASLPRNLRINGAAAKARGMDAFRSMGGRRRCEERREQKRIMMRAAMSTGGPALAPPQRETVGDFVGLCLLIDFPDELGTIDQGEVESFCNQQGYSGFGNNGSVRDYFFDNSLGAFRYTNVVTAYIRAQHPKTHYTNPAIPHGTRARQLIREALDHLVSQGFDFGQLTVDAQGFVYAMNVYYAGFNQNNWGEGLWPHAWSLAAPYDLGGGRRAFDYQFTDMGDELTLGTFCHENGHMICDYPDLYDYGYESSGVGAWCLMCAGGSDDKNPAQISAYLKRLSGWSSEVVPITHGAQISLAAAQNRFAMHAKSPTEYFIVENRQQSGRDASLPGSGLAIWHVDEMGNNNNEQMSAGEHYELSLEQADNAFDLEKLQGQLGDAGDLYPIAGNDRFGDVTAPDSRWWDGTASQLDLRDITESNGIVAFEARLADEEVPPRLSGSSDPDLPIPDDEAVGISDSIALTGDAEIMSLVVGVDITHTYRGDLRVTLHAPSGQSVVLHERRQGGSADHLQRSYDVASTPGLAALIGSPAAGDWILHVQDLAPADVGVLNHWEIEIEGQAPAGIVLAEAPGAHIPDDDPGGIERTLSTTESGTITQIEVSIDITHSYIQDLRVALVSPAGTSADLHRNSGGSADNILETYTATSTPALLALLGEGASGEWKLRVSDHAGLDVGKLNAWEVRLELAPSG